MLNDLQTILYRLMLTQWTLSLLFFNNSTPLLPNVSQSGIYGLSRLRRPFSSALIQLRHAAACPNFDRTRGGVYPSPVGFWTVGGSQSIQKDSKHWGDTRSTQKGPNWWIQTQDPFAVRQF